MSDVSPERDWFEKADLSINGDDFIPLGLCDETSF